MVSIVCTAAGMCVSSPGNECVVTPHNVNDKASSRVTEARTDHFTQNIGFLTGRFIDFTTTKTSYNDRNQPTRYTILHTELSFTLYLPQSK